MEVAGNVIVALVPVRAVPDADVRHLDLAMVDHVVLVGAPSPTGPLLGAKLLDDIPRVILRDGQGSISSLDEGPQHC